LSSPFAVRRSSGAGRKVHRSGVGGPGGWSSGFGVRVCRSLWVA
jgi:hypothetical protein